MERRILLVIVVVVVIVAATASAVVILLLGQPPPTGPAHVYSLEGDSEWFQLPGGETTDIFAIVTDKGIPLFDVPVDISVAPDTEGTLSDTSARTDDEGIARAEYTSFNRTANVTLTFTFMATLDGEEVQESIEVLQLGIGQEPLRARAKGVAQRSSNRLPIEGATIQINILNTTALPLGSETFFSNNTDDRGRYLLEDMPPREALIQVVKSGFKSDRENLTLVAGKNTRVDFVLEELEGKTLIVWHTYTGKEEDEFLKMVDRYRNTRPDLSVIVEFQPFAGAPEKFIVSATAGNAPDVMRFQNDRLGEVAELGFMEPLDARLDPATIQRYTPDTLNTMRIKGQIYALPATQDLLAVIYNVDHFQEAGESLPEDDWTTDDLIRIATNLTTQGRWGFVTPMAIGFYWFPWLAGYGGEIFTVPDTVPITEDAHVGIDNEEAAKSVLFMHSLDKVHGVMFSNPGEDTMLTEFLAGRVSMITTGPWNVPSIERAEIDFGIVPYPIVSDTDLRAKPVLGVKGFGIWKLSPVKEDAFEFIKFITSPEEQKKFALGVDGPGTNALPTAQAAFTDPEVQANPVIARFLEQVKNSSGFPSRPEMANVWGPLTDALTFVYEQVTADPDDPAAVAAARQLLSDEEEEIYG